MDIVSYDPAAEDVNVLRKGEVRVAFWNLADASEAAEIYADWAHDSRDGYEDVWPLSFRVRSEDGTVQDFEVQREYMAEFSATPFEVKP